VPTLVRLSGLKLSQIHTLSRRAAQIYEDSFGPNEHNAQDKDSAALLLALRQSGDSSTQANAYPRGVSPREDAPTPRAAPAKNWITMMNGLGGAGRDGGTESPASSGGLEDDHSQRLYVLVVI